MSICTRKQLLPVSCWMSISISIRPRANGRNCLYCSMFTAWDGSVQSVPSSTGQLSGSRNVFSIWPMLASLRPLANRSHRFTRSCSTTMPSFFTFRFEIAVLNDLKLTQPRDLISQFLVSTAV
uniref:(northern house mosquito) hypothetical protein n=1 Tax=Culex pipiens TaxID=7175 RepID=A0A8D8FAH7_CULPI